MSNQIESEHFPYVREGWPKSERGEVFRISSVGILAHIGELVGGKRIGPTFLLVEKKDEEGHPWSIASGHVDPSDRSVFETAKREFQEEVGLQIETSKLETFLVCENPQKKTKQVIFSYELNEREYDALMSLGKWISTGGGIEICERNEEGEEIGRLALVLAMSMFYRGHFITASVARFRWDFWKGIKDKLEGLRIV